jgi:hypothetical protein
MGYRYFSSLWGYYSLEKCNMRRVVILYWGLNCRGLLGDLDGWKSWRSHSKGTRRLFILDWHLVLGKEHAGIHFTFLTHRNQVKAACILLSSDCLGILQCIYSACTKVSSSCVSHSVCSLLKLALSSVHFVSIQMVLKSKRCSFLTWWSLKYSLVNHTLWANCWESWLRIPNLVEPWLDRRETDWSNTCPSP